MKNIKVKVCGITDEKNYCDLKKYPISYFGFIFYKKSPRYIFKNNRISFIKDIPNKVAVFVNEDFKEVLRISKEYNFSIVQLHGNESDNYCRKLRDDGLNIIKSHLIKDQKDFNKINSNNVDYNLFDYKSQIYGGSGKSFDWDLLNKISIKKKYFLSGGISLENFNEFKKINNKNYLYALDLNSKFEKYPGYKDVNLIEKFFNLIV